MTKTAAVVLSAILSMKPKSSKLKTKEVNLTTFIQSVIHKFNTFGTDDMIAEGDSDMLNFMPLKNKTPLQIADAL